MINELHLLIRDVAAQYPNQGPHDLAVHVAKLTPEHDLPAFYQEALTTVVRDILGQDRRVALSGPKITQQTTSTPQYRSAKIAQRRTWWAGVLASRVHTGGGNWLNVAACGRKELAYCIEERQTQIDGFLKQIGNFERLIDLLNRHAVDTVADLPEQTDWHN